MDHQDLPIIGTVLQFWKDTFRAVHDMPDVFVASTMLVVVLNYVYVPALLVGQFVGGGFDPIFFSYIIAITLATMPFTFNAVSSLVPLNETTSALRIEGKGRLLLYLLALSLVSLAALIFRVLPTTIGDLLVFAASIAAYILVFRIVKRPPLARLNTRYVGWPGAKMLLNDVWNKRIVVSVNIGYVLRHYVAGVCALLPFAFPIAIFAPYVRSSDFARLAYAIATAPVVVFLITIFFMVLIPIIRHILRSIVLATGPSHSAAPDADAPQG